MTNLPAIVIISFLTNLTENIHLDGSRKTMIETVRKQCVHEWIEGRATHSHTNVTILHETIRRYRRVWQPINTMPPLPTVVPRPEQKVMLVPGGGGGEPPVIVGRFSTPETNEDNSCRLFLVDFLTETNRIYRFEGTADLSNWEYLQPEIDGTGEPDTFYDAQVGSKAYRIVTREGVLPEELP